MEQRSSQQSNNLLAIIGGVLVVVGVLALIIASWSSFTPLGRILTAALPLAALYIITATASTHAESKHIGKYSLITASTILPFVLGVILFQSGVFDVVDAALITLLALVSTANAGFIEFMYGDKYHTPLTLISLLVSAISLTAWLELEPSGGLTITLLTGALMLGLGMMQRSVAQKDGSATWLTIGAVVTLGSLAILPAMISGDYLDYALGETFTPLFYVIASGIAISLASLFSKLWQSEKDSKYLYDIRVLSEQISALMLVVPAAFATLASDNPGPFLVLLGASLVSIGISTQVRVGTFRVLGIIGLIIGLFRLILFGLSELAAIWPIVLVATGVLFLLFAVFGARKASTWTSHLLAQPVNSWQQLGEPFKKSAPAEKKAGTNDHSGWFWLAAGILILWLISSL